MQFITSSLTRGVILFMMLIAEHSILAEIDPDENRDSVQLIESRGFKAETHFITTYDGYILALHRIINPDDVNSTRKVVVLQHGLLASSADFILNSPGEGPKIFKELSSRYVGKNLGFTLSRLGYDVWLGNVRGNTYCRNHTKLLPTNRKFWDFTWDEHALIDLPTTIDYVRNATKSKTVGYIGHSQGTLVMFALMSSKKEYNDVIKPFIALAPIGTVAGVRTPVKYLANNQILLDYFRWRGGEFLPSTAYIRSLAERVCESRYTFVCTNLMFVLAGYDQEQLNITRTAVYLTHTPAGTSAWNMVHLAQMVKTEKRVQRFDLGRLGNMQKYGQEKPPEYHFERITNKYIALMSSQNDWLSDSRDVDYIRSKLVMPPILDYVVEYPQWNHVDFIWGKDAGRIINSKIVKLLDEFAEPAGDADNGEI